MDQQGIERRLEKIETKLAFLEDFLERLQETAVEGNARLDKMRVEQTAMKTRLFQLSQDMEEVPNRKPPHY